MMPNPKPAPDRDRAGGGAGLTEAQAAILRALAESDATLAQEYTGAWSLWRGGWEVTRFVRGQRREVDALFARGLLRRDERRPGLAYGLLTDAGRQALSPTGGAAAEVRDGE